MKIRLIFAATLSGFALFLGGCVPVGQSAFRGSGVDSVLVDDVLSTAASQVRRCYRAPRVASAGKQIVTRLRVHLNSDGTLAALPQIVEQYGVTPDSQPYAGPMAEAATLAVIRCSPLRLPAELYGSVWRSFELNFSPAARV